MYATVDIREHQIVTRDMLSIVPLRSRPTTPEMSAVVSGILEATGYEIDETPLDRIWKRVAEVQRATQDRYFGSGTRIPIPQSDKLKDTRLTAEKLAYLQQQMAEYGRIFAPFRPQPRWDDASIARYMKD